MVVVPVPVVLVVLDWGGAEEENDFGATVRRGVRRPPNPPTPLYGTTGTTIVTATAVAIYTVLEEESESEVENNRK